MGGGGAGGVFREAGGLLLLLHWVCGAEGGSKVVAGGELVELVELGELVADVKYALCLLTPISVFLWPVKQYNPDCKLLDGHALEECQTALDSLELTVGSTILYWRSFRWTLTAWN